MLLEGTGGKNMVHAEKHFFKVPERRGSNRLISLDGQVFEPTHSAGTVIFTQGMGKFKFGDYFGQQCDERVIESVVSFAKANMSK